MSQLSLTGFAEPPPVEPIVDEETRALAERLPRWLHLGCCSWTFPGWAGLVYRGRPSESALARHGLSALARWPLFGAAEIDRSFYRPLTVEELRRYAAQLPPGYPCLSKVWNEITTHTFPNHPRLGDRAGARNPRFLDGALAREVLAPYLEAFASHAGPMIFQLSPIPNVGGRDPAGFGRLLDRLLGGLPRELRYAFELRDRELLTPRYLEVLAAHGAAHVFNSWQNMPPVGAQLDFAGVGAAPFVVARLLQPPGIDYESRRHACEPFDRLVDPRPELRADVLRLVEACRAGGRELFVLIDNKAEGSAPLTARALAAAIVDTLSRCDSSPSSSSP